MKWLFWLALAGLGWAQPREGFLTVPGGPVYYRVLTEGEGVPLVILHGGPGGSSCSMGVFADLPGRPVVVYDQLGSGRSGRPRDEGLWTVERFVEELHSLRQQLGLRRMHLMGHSWGGALAAAYVLTKGSAGIESLILASALLSTADWIADAQVLKRQLPAELQEVMARHEAAGTTDHPDYRRAEQEYNRRFVSRKPRGPVTDCAGSVRNELIYRQMWGPTEFHATGSLKSFDVTGRLGQLRLPVLFLVGQYDEARPVTAARYQQMVQGAKLAVIAEAAHALWFDNREETLRVLKDWLAQGYQN